jgi:hypothetical protein
LVEAPRILFVPVSGAFGMGEYARSLGIAQAVRRQWPKADIHFILSRQAPYAASAPFPSTLLDSSPTFHTAQVIESFQAPRRHLRQRRAHSAVARGASCGRTRRFYQRAGPSKAQGVSVALDALDR